MARVSPSRHRARFPHRSPAVGADLSASSAPWSAVHGAYPAGALRATESAPDGFADAARLLDDPTRNTAPSDPHSPCRRRPGARALRTGGTSRRAHAALRAFILWLGLLLPAGSGAEEAVEAPLALESLLLDGTAAGSRLVVVGERGHVLVSTDDGASWKQARVPTRAMLTAVHMHDERTGWAVGHDAVILRTDDGGESWEMVHQAPEEERPLLDVWFRDERSGFAVGAYGYFLATDDGGKSWTSRMISEDDFHMNALVAASGNRRLYIAAEAGVAYRSDDGGATWRELPSPYAGSWFGALAIDEEKVLLTGLRGHLFRSEDGGESWTQVATDSNATLTGAVRLPSGAVLVTGLEGVLLTSEDEGRSVSFARLPSREGISAALPLADGGVLLVGEFGVRRLTQDE